MATIGPNPDFDADAAAQVLRDAMKGIGTRESDLVQVLTSHNLEQRQEIEKNYQSLFGESLVDELCSETKGSFEDGCLALLKDRDEFRVETLHDALSGGGTNENLLIDILTPLNSDELQCVKDKYSETFEESLDDKIESDVSGDLQRFMKSLLAGGRNEGGDDDVDDDCAREDAEKLYNAADGLGTDEEGFMDVIMRRSWSSLRRVAEIYDEMEEGKTLLDVIDSEFGNDYLAFLLKSIVRHAIDRHSYKAWVLFRCMKGAGTSEKELMYNIIQHSEVDLADIREAFPGLPENEDGMPLLEMVDSDVGGDFGDLLKGLVSGN